ncbi:conserved hypothetical protein [Ricinus communis]|uniref:Uncharacterized protein n=1 Tax=Ricinus communis TaxID=3988 RepID=B9RIN4_RICCO|nr:conserved hypothetical protein [Ricinus communis]
MAFMLAIKLKNSTLPEYNALHGAQMRRHQGKRRSTVDDSDHGLCVENQDKNMFKLLLRLISML